MSFETGVFPVLVSEDAATESLSPQVRGGLNASSATPLHVQLSDLMRVKRRERTFRLRPNLWRSMA